MGKHKHHISISNEIQIKVNSFSKIYIHQNHKATTLNYNLNIRNNICIISALVEQVSLQFSETIDWTLLCLFALEVFEIWCVPAMLSINNTHINHQRSSICLNYWLCNWKLHDSFVQFYKGTMSIFHWGINGWKMILFLKHHYINQLKNHHLDFNIEHFF